MLPIVKDIVLQCCLQHLRHLSRPVIVVAHIVQYNLPPLPAAHNISERPSEITGDVVVDNGVDTGVSVCHAVPQYPKRLVVGT